jgi:HD-GYP domain-containing protein (c-di-GMP phosphodiesterase class II)
MLRLADLLGGLSLVADLGFGLPPGTAVRSSVVAAALARRVDLCDDDVRDCFYTGLLMHVGCVSVAHESAAAFGDDLALNRAVARTNFADPGDVAATLVPELTRGMPSEVARRAAAFALSEGSAWGRRTDVGVCEVGRDTACRLGLPVSTQEAMYHVYESWLGGWAPSGLRGDDIPVASRVARVATDAALFAQLGGVDAAVAAVRGRAGVILDPGLVTAFVRDAGAILAEVDRGDPLDRLLADEPEPVVTLGAAGLSAVARAFGDLADVKAPFLHGHSKEVARLATGGARRLGLDDDAVALVELAGLLHDVGRVGVSNAIWEKPAALSRVEWEQVRMHSYFSERILSASPSLQPVAMIAGMHHERLDGSGYHRSARAGSVPMASRLLAAADTYAAMTQTRPYRAALSGEQAVGELHQQVDSGRLDHDAVAAVAAEAGQQVRRRRRARPAGLSDREVEVLTLIARGCSNAEVAERLVISRRTAEHHAQHIYTKIGGSTRAAAALFAVEHDLVRPE